MAQINHNISSPNDNLGDQLRTAFGNQNTMNTELYDTKVDEVAGKGLSTNDFTNTLKAKLDALNAGAGINVQADWEQEDDTADDYIKNKPAEMFSSVGSFHYVDLATITTPLTVLATVEKKITNDTASTETNVLNAPYGISTMWDATNNQLDFTQCAIGDLVTVIPAIEITTTATNQTFQIYIKMGIGSATPTTKQVYNGALATIGTIIINPTRDFTIDTLDNKDYPAEIYILSSANATVKSGELDIKVVRKDINIIYASGVGVTNLSYTPNPASGTIVSDTGSDAVLLLADGTNAGLLKPAKYTVLENTSGTNTGDQDLSGLQPKGVRVTNATTTGSYAVNWTAGDVWQLTLTGATTITDTNLPTGTATKVIELIVKGSFAITLPGYWEATPSSGTYTGAKWNHFVISCVNGTTSSEKVIYSNEVLAT